MSDVTVKIGGIAPGKRPYMEIRVCMGSEMSELAKAILRALYGADVAYPHQDSPFFKDCK